MSEKRLKYYSQTEVAFASGSSVSLNQSSSENLSVTLPADFQKRMACDIADILAEIKKTNLFLAEILGDEMK